MGSKPPPPPAETLADKCERLALRMDAPTQQSDLRISVQLIRVLAALRGRAAQQPLEAAELDAVIEAAMRARRLYFVERPDGTGPSGSTPRHQVNRRKGIDHDGERCVPSLG